MNESERDSFQELKRNIQKVTKETEKNVLKKIEITTFISGTLHIGTIIATVFLVLNGFQVIEQMKSDSKILKNALEVMINESKVIEVLQISSDQEELLLGRENKNFKLNIGEVDWIQVTLINNSNEIIKVLPFLTRLNHKCVVSYGGTVKNLDKMSEDFNINGEEIYPKSIKQFQIQVNDGTENCPRAVVGEQFRLKILSETIIKENT